MKKYVALILCVCMICTFAVPVGAAQEPIVVYSKTTILDNGMIALDEVLVYSENSRSTDITRTRRRTISDNGTTIAVIAFTATFRYDGNSVSVISKSVTQCDIYEGWNYTQTSFTSSGGTVTLNGKLSKWLLINKSFQLTLTCDKNGNISYT